VVVNLDIAPVEGLDSVTVANYLDIVVYGPTTVNSLGETPVINQRPWAAQVVPQIVTGGTMATRRLRAFNVRDWNPQIHPTSELLRYELIGVTDAHVLDFLIDGFNARNAAVIEDAAEVMDPAVALFWGASYSNMEDVVDDLIEQIVEGDLTAADISGFRARIVAQRAAAVALAGISPGTSVEHTIVGADYTLLQNMLRSLLGDPEDVTPVGPNNWIFREVAMLWVGTSGITTTGMHNLQLQHGTVVGTLNPTTGNLTEFAAIVTTVLGNDNGSVMHDADNRLERAIIIATAEATGDLLDAFLSVIDALVADPVVRLFLQ
jgi:hypothetical protein